MKTVRPTPPPSADQALRNLFAQRADDVASAPDIASVAVGRARRISRRRTSIGSVAATLAFALTLGTVVSLRGWWITDENRGATGVAGFGAVEFDARPTEQPIDYSPVLLRVDVALDDRIYDSAVDKWVMAENTDPATVVRVPVGWLATDQRGIRLFTPNGTTWPVSDEQARWTVNPDGTQIALVSGTTLSVRTVTKNGAVEAESTTVPTGETPIGFVASTVVLLSAAGQVDAWRPDGSLDESELTYVYSSRSAETFGIMPSPGSGQPCLVKVATRATGLRTVAMAGCHELLGQGSQRATLSPDGRYLAMPFDGGMWIINLARSVAASAANPSAPPVWEATCAADSDATPVWQDATTVVTTAHGAVIACNIDGVQRDVRLPRDVEATGRLVPRRVV